MSFSKVHWRMAVLEKPRRFNSSTVSRCLRSRSAASCFSRRLRWQSHSLGCRSRPKSPFPSVRYHIRKGGYGFLNRFFFGVAECKHDYLPDKYHLPSCSPFQSKRNWNRAVISRCFMLSSVSVLTCPFSRAASRIRLL